MAGGSALRVVGPATVAVTGSSFTDNVCHGRGGAVFLGSGITASFDGCTFRGNTARLGGALACFQGSDVSVVRSTLVANAGSRSTLATPERIARALVRLKPSVVAASLVQTLSWQDRKARKIRRASKREFRSTLQRLLPLIGAEDLL